MAAGEAGRSGMTGLLIRGIGQLVTNDPDRPGLLGVVEHAADVEKGDAGWSAAWMLVISTPAVRGDQRQYESSTLVEYSPVHSRASSSSRTISSIKA